MGGLAAPEVRLWWWLGALAVEYVSPALGFYTPGLGRADTSAWTVEGGHLAERVGLFVIICLGESLIVTGATFAEMPWTTPVVLAFASSFVATAAVWSLFFARAFEAASKTFRHAEDVGAVARRAYTYAPIVLIAGIVVAAVGDEFALADPLGHSEPHVALTILGGPALFLFGSSLSFFAVRGRWATARLVGVAALGVVGLAWAAMSPLTMSLISTGLLLVVAIWEGRRQRSGAAAV